MFSHDDYMTFKRIQKEIDEEDIRNVLECSYEGVTVDDELMEIIRRRYRDRMDADYYEIADAVIRDELNSRKMLPDRIYI